MSLVGFKAQNHRQQVKRKGPNPTVDDRGTDPALYAAWNARFRFTIDVAAADHNAKCPRFYTIETDGLAHSWTGERVWCNPPYSNIGPWVEKAWLEHRGGADLIVLLLPANRTEQNWWNEMVEPYRDRQSSPLSVEFLKGRLRFVRAGATTIGPNERPPFGCCLLIWGEKVTNTRIVYGARCVWWNTITHAATTPNGLPCCPHCHNVLYEYGTEREWWNSATQHEHNGHPGYKTFLEWLRGRCYPNYPTAVAAYENAEGTLL